MHTIDIWKILAGIAIFLLGIKFLEESLQQLSGRGFKLFLKKHTSNKIKAIGSGALVTALLQSSSLVSLMVLAFAGAGILTMYNALALILGANLGTTFTGWMIALIGFKLNFEILALPIAGIAGLLFTLTGKNSKLNNWSRFFFGFSFLFIGLGFIKTGIEDYINTIDLTTFQQYPVFIFLLIGFIITSIIQSSSATVAITLSALNAGAISLFDATAIVLGSEIGTTIKLFIAAANGAAVKRRIAIGNFIFNTCGVLVVFILLRPINEFITSVLGIHDQLIALVFFQSLVNIISIILFYPLLKPLGNFLEKRFQSNEDETLFIHKIPATEPLLALDAMENETKHFLFSVLDFAMHCFENKNHLQQQMKFSKKFTEHSLHGKYEHIKYLHGEIHSFYISLQNKLQQKEELEKLDRLISSVRNSMYAAKNFKDALHDIDQLRNSANDTKFGFYEETKASVSSFFELSMQLLLKNEASTADELAGIYKSVTQGYNHTLKQLYHETTAGHVNEKEITTLLNFNREIYTAYKSVFFAVKDYLLDKKQSRYFDEQPGFIR
jgi:phosphate:Na+ symporter